MRQKSKLLSMIITFITAVAVLFVCIFTLVDKKKTNSTENSTMSYSLTDTIDTSKLKFEVVDESAKTCKFVGLDSSLGFFTDNTLAIPEKATIGTSEYTVVEIDTTSKLSPIAKNGKTLTTMYAYGSWITALIVPKTVTKITEGSFYGMASLQYLETPMPDTIVSSTSTQTGKWGIHKLFSYGFMRTDGPGDQGEYERYSAGASDNHMISSTVAWYDVVVNSKIYYYVPNALEKIVITKASTLGNRTFCELDSLQEVVLPEGLTTVGEYTFESCDLLQDVTIPKTLGTLGDGMFAECSSMTSIVIPRTYTIPKSFLGGCTSLEEVIMPTSVTAIEDSAFANCTNLRIKLYKTDPADNYDGGVDSSIIFPEGLESIGQYAFQGVNTIKRISVPKDVKSIGEGAFLDCPNIEYISIPFVGNKQGSDSDPKKNNLGYIFGTSSDDADYYRRVQNGVTYTFPKKLTTVNITGETRIEKAVLGNLCYINNNTVQCGVTSITINQLALIEAGAMAGSNALVDISIPHIGSYNDNSRFGLLFYYDTTPANNTDAVNQAGARATSQSGGTYWVPTSLENVVITYQSTIKSGSFANCETLKYVEIGNYTTYIESDIFFNNKSLASIKLPFVGSERGVYYYYWTHWRNNYLRNMLTWAFSGSASDETYQDNTISSGSYYRRYIPLALKSVEITNETVIDYRSFRWLTSLETLTISDDEKILSRIEAGAAEGCVNLTTLNLPFIGYDRNTAGQDGGAYRAAYIFGSGGSGYNAGGYTVPNGLKTINVDFVNRVPSYAFNGLSSVSTVSFGSKVTSIGNYAFNNCTSLSDLEYTSGTAFTNVGNYAFYNCQRINTIEQAVPEYVNGRIALGDYAFARTSISEIDFTLLKSVGNYCFSGCLNLTEANVTSNLTSFGNGVFADCYYLTDVTLSEGQATEYLFKNCLSLRNVDLSSVIIDGIIPKGIFSGCAQLQWGDGIAANGLVLNDQITTIGAEAFYGCSGMRRFVIPSNVISIGDKAFNGCSGLENITIPVKTTKIGKEVFTDYIGGDFVIWVYINEEEWPWQSGWNCNNPVRVLPGTDDSMYTFAICDALRGYIITGFKPEFEGRITGTIVLPKTHDGVKVVGVDKDVFITQVGVTKIVIPANIDVIAAGAFNNTRRIDLYFEDTIAKAPTGFDHINYVALSNQYKTAAELQKIVDAGLVFFGGDWQYGTSVGNSNVPYVKTSKIVYKIDEARQIMYNSTAWTPSVVSATLPATVITNDSISRVDNTVPVDVFDYKYYDNVNAGKASIDTRIIQSEYEEYLAASGSYKTMLVGEGRASFNIAKAEIQIYYNEDELMSFREVDYNPYKAWSNASWNTSLVTGIESTYTFGGRLEVRNPNAGIYFIYDQEANEDFYWSSSWYVLYKGRNVTDNFTVKVYLELTVHKLDVELKWTGGAKDADGKYAYQYNGKDVTPVAQAFTTDGTALPYDICGVRVVRGSEVLTKYPGNSNTGNAYLSASADINYNLVNGEVDDATAIHCAYYIVNANLIITISDYEYVIGYDDLEYSFSNWNNHSYYLAENLAEGSVIKGTILSQSFTQDGYTYSSHDKTLYTYSNGGIAWKNQEFSTGTILYNHTNKPELDYLIGRYNDQGQLIEIENDYYDVTLDVSVRINYNEFDYQYTVNGTVLPLTLTGLSADEKTYETTFHTEGVPSQVLLELINSGLLQSSCDVVYRYEGNTIGTTAPLTLLEIGDYSLSVEASRMNFETLRHNIVIHVLRSDIQWRNLDKEYDGLDVDLTTFITKKDSGQSIQLTKHTKNGSSYITASECVNPGTYYIHIVAEETPYFNAVDTYYKFVISKRVIHIYVDRSNYFDPMSSITPSRPWSEGNKYYITVDSSALSASDRRYMVGDDEVYGVLWTNSSSPGVYDTSVAGDWYWSPAWAVYSTSNPVLNKAGTYYDIQLHGAFEITYLDMDIEHEGVDTLYDGNLYQSTVNVNDPVAGYTIYYSLVEPSIEFDEEARLYKDTGAKWRSTINYSFQAPGVYQVWFKVVAPNYQTYYGSDIVKISYVPITFDDPSELQVDDYGKLYIDYDGFDHAIVIENPSPMGTYVEYSIDGEHWTTTPYSFYEIYDGYVVRYRLSYPNYETIHGSYAFRITDEFLTSLDTFVYSTPYSGVYDAALHGIGVTVTYPGLTDYTVYYRESGTLMPWSSTPIQYVNAGNYTIDYMVVANGFKSYKGTSTVAIAKASLSSVGITNYADDYDGEKHGVTVLNTNSYPGVEVYYTTNPDIAYLDSMDYGAWTKTPIEFVNVGVYTVYVRFVLKNYADRTLSGTVVITKAHPDIDYTDGYQVEYLGKPVTVADLGVTTCHDGYCLPTYYEATYTAGTYVITSSTPITAPTVLGTYVVLLNYADTANCFAGSVQFGFDIVPRKVYVQYDENLEYTGTELNPNPTIDSGTGDILYVTSVCFEMTGSIATNPTAIGKYHYSFTFATPQTNYVIVEPDSPEMATYPYIFNITPINLNVKFETSMPYNYADLRYWYKDSGWEEFDCFNRLLDGHAYEATMQSTSYARGTYIYNSESAAGADANTIIVSGDRIIDTRNGGVDVTHLYNITYDIVVKIVLPDLVVSCDDREVEYDGNPYGLVITVPDSVRNLTYYYATANEYERGEWRSHTITYINAGEYDIYFKITSPSYEDYIGHATLTITKTNLVIDFNDFDGTYDAYPQYSTHTVKNSSGKNIVGFDTSLASVRYFKKDMYDINDLEELYGNFDETNPLYLEGLTGMVDAGTYYVCVIYMEAGNYRTSYSIGEATVKQRELDVTLNVNYFRSFDYDGTKKGVTLGSASIVSQSNLVYGHRIVGSTAQTIIQTISPNAGTYNGSDGFEFKYENMYKTIVIKDLAGNVVTTNYKPRVSDSQLQIIINKIALDQFEAEDLEREYDGTPANPSIITPSDGIVSYIYYKVVDGTISSTPCTAEEACNVGTYYVLCDIGEGTNYYAWMGSSVSAYVTITKCIKEVTWNNLTTVFNGTYQAPIATIVDVFGDVIPVDIGVRYAGDIFPGALHAGLYEVIASPASENYELTSNIELFTIEIATFELEFKDKTDADDTEWVLFFDKTRWENFPSTVALFNEAKNGMPSIMTKSMSAGSYILPSDFILNYSAWVDAEDVSSSIDFQINGNVTILSNAITYEAEDQSIPYTGKAYKAEDFLTIITPVKRNVRIKWSVDAESPNSSESPEFTEVGSHVVNFALSADNYDDVEDSFVITINPKQSFINFTDTLNKVYNGVEVDATAVRKVINGEFNGDYSDLIYTFYSTSSSTPLSESPVDTGEYKVVITSAADVGTNLNYTTLYEERLFEITAKTITLEAKFDYEVSSSGLASRWQSGQVAVGPSTNKGLGSYNTLYYEVATVDTAIARGLYKAYEVVNYNFASTTYTFASTSSTGDFDLLEFAFTWNVIATQRYDEHHNLGLDVSYNYNIELIFEVNIHYPYMTVNLPDLEFDYDGNYHYGNELGALVVPSSPRNLKKYYGASASNLSQVPIDTYKYDLPGTYTIHYRYVCDEFEPSEGSFTITIGYDSRVVTVPNLSKTYDGDTVGTQIYGYYVPNYTTSLGTSGMPDNYDLTKVTMVYYKKGYKTPLPYVVDAGSYTYVLTIPASTYYSESVIEGEFTIDRKVIYVDGNYEAGYQAKQVSYNDFNTLTSAYVMKFADGTIISQNFRFYNLVIQTANGSIGKYRGGQDTLTIASSPQIYYGTTDMSNNYQVLLYKKDTYEASITIKEGLIVAEPVNLSTQYDGQMHSASVRVWSPADKYTLSYSESYDGVYTSENIEKNLVGEYTIYIKIKAPNYEDLIIAANISITRATTWVKIPAMDKFYDGMPVLVPTNITTNNTEVTKYITSFEQWSDVANAWGDLASTEFPKNAGKYRLKVSVEATANYLAADEVIREFEIKGIRVSLNWSATTFVYNGMSQAPKVTFDAIPGDPVNIIYTIVPAADNLVIDADHKSIGRYTITATLDGDSAKNYTFDDSQISQTFVISKRTVTVNLQKSITYDNALHTFVYDKDNGYYLNNIVDGHYSSATLSSLFKAPGNYTSIDHFKWNSTSDDVIILDSNNHNEDVTFNYFVDYDNSLISLNINYSYINYTIENYDSVYDGQAHGINIKINNIFPIDQPQPVITYSETLNGTYTTTRPLYTNVISYKTIYFRITCPGYATINSVDSPDAACYGTVNITKKDAGLRLENEYQVFDKYYDGMPVSAPAMVYADMGVLARTISYTWLKQETDPTKANYLDWSEVAEAKYVGNYKLKVELAGTDNYDNGTYSVDFVIRKRDVLITLPNADSQATMVYSGLLWEMPVTSDMVEKALSNDSSRGLISGDVLTGKVLSISASSGTYDDSTDFQWESGYQIYSGDQDVRGNYNVTIDMRLIITKAKMQVEAASYSGTYDAKPHTISVNVKNPLIGYTLEFATENKSDAFSAAEVYKTTTGKITVYYRITAPDFEDFNGAEMIEILGVVNDGKQIGPSGEIFYGDEYETPKYVGSSTGLQTVTYYQGSTLLGGDKPANAGTYRYVIHLDTDGIYAAEDYEGTFVIKPYVVKVNWSGLSQEYDGTAKKPSATINTLETTGLALTVDDTYKHTDVGTYNVEVSYANTNYLLSEATKTFEITKKKIVVPDIKPDMSFRYEFKIPVLDTDGMPVLDEEGNETYYEFGDNIQVTDVDGNIYVLDEDGTITAILNPDGTLQDDNPELPYKIVIDTNKNACEDDEKRTIKVVLDDPDNNCWDAVSNPDSAQTFNYVIKDYTFPDADDDLDVEASLGGKAFEYADGEEIKPIPTVVLKYAGSEIATLDTSYYEVIYENNTEITDNAKAIVKGIGNYDFTIELPFKIIDKKAQILTLSDGVKPMFIRIKTEATGITVIEDGSDERTGEDRDDFYLGHVHQGTKINKLLDQFDTPSAEIKVYDNKGTLIDPSKYGTTVVGTGYKLEYFDTKTNIVLDSIEVLIFGDVDGDGTISLADGAVINRMTTANLDVKITLEKILNGEMASDEKYSYFTAVNYYAAVTKRDSQTGNSVSLAMKTEILKCTRAKDPIDFNAEYEII